MHTCPNHLWNGCTHSDKQFKYVKAFNKHVAKCSMARKQSETEEMDLRPLLKQVVSRLSKLEQEFAILKTENRHLREQVRAPTIRGAYDVRAEGEVPLHGFGNWSSEFFLKNLKKTDDYYMEKIGQSVVECPIDTFISAVFFVANGETRLVRIGKERDAKGNPLTAELNFKKRRLKVSWTAAVKRIFERPFLPDQEDIAEELGKELTPDLVKGLNYYARWLTDRPSKKHKTWHTWKAKSNLLMAIANFYVPERKKDLTREERADMFFQQELHNGRWWVQPRVWTMRRIVDMYDYLLGPSKDYKEALNAYFKDRPERLQEYRAAGGSLV